MFRISLRLILAALFTLTAAGILFYAKADPVPHDKSARVTPADFWKALARPEKTQRPSDILVYPPQRGVQLVTCIGHSDATRSVWKYLYVISPSGTQTVESRLTTMGVAFQTPWQMAGWVRNGPWAAFALAAALLVWPWVVGLVKVFAEANVKKSPAEPIAPPAPKVTSVHLEKLHALEDELEGGLAGGNAPPSTTAPAGAQTAGTSVPAPVALTGGELEQTEKKAEEEKDYRGDYYPVAKPREHGFSLLELLVVIGIIGVLLALLLPTLSGARRDANQIACEANLHSIAQGLLIYENENNDCIPASYSYSGQQIVNGVQTFSQMGYTHWSYFLYHSGSTPTNAFSCPELDGGGLPPTNTTADNLLPGQESELPGAIDQQAPRVAYTLNEALSPRNKFTVGFQAAVRVYQFIRASSVPNSSGTILATEWGPNAARFAGTPVPNQPLPNQSQQGSSPSSSPGFYIYSHRPVHGFVGLDGQLDMYQLAPTVHYRRVTAADLDPDPGTAASSTTRLDWVGRNHGKVNTYPDQRRTNFLYLDGHVECKSIYDTLQPFEWGETFYTLKPNDDLQKQ